MTIPVTRVDPRNPISQAYVRVQLGVNAEGLPTWLSGVQSPGGSSPTISNVVAAAIPNDVIIANQELVGTDFFLKPTKGTSGIDYQYQLMITLSDGQVFGESVQQICLNTV